MLEAREETFYQKLGSYFPKKRENAWLRFLQTGLPTKHVEAYQYVRLKDLFEFPFEKKPAIEKTPIPTLESSLVFINGKFSEQHSKVPKGVIALELSKAAKIYGHYLDFRLKRFLEEEKDPFALLNSAMHEEALFIYLPPALSVEKPIEIVYLQSEPDAILFPKIQIFAAKGASAQIVLRRSESAKNLWINEVIDIALDEGASLSIMDIAEEDPSVFRFASVRASLKHSSNFKSVSATSGGRVSRYDYGVELLGEEASCCLKGLWNLSQARRHHVNVEMRHKAPNASSSQLFKGVLNDVTKSSFTGKIFVDQKAQKTQAYQMNRNLIVGKNAAANTKPNLEIFADDVKASHGATIGKLNQEDLFYLTSRGMEKSLAKKLLVHAFIEEIIEAFSHLPLKEQAKSLFSHL